MSFYSMASMGVSCFGGTFCLVFLREHHKNTSISPKKATHPFRTQTCPLKNNTPGPLVSSTWRSAFEVRTRRPLSTWPLAAS